MSDAVADPGDRAPNDVSGTPVVESASGERQCSKCHHRPPAGKHRWCRECQNEARRERTKKKHRRRSASRSQSQRTEQAANAGENLHGENGGQSGTQDGERRGNAGQFRPGTNSHTDEVFRRGPDRMPRSPKLMLACIAVDRRQEIYDGLSFIAASARTKPFAFLKLVEMMGDRIEGKPTQHVVSEQRRSTVFTLAAEAVTPEDARPTAPDETPSPAQPTVDLAQLPPGLQVQGYAVVPPPA